MKTENNTNNGMGCVNFFVVLLEIAFIVMKIAGVIEWSWVWVLAPVWIYVALILFLVIIIAIIET